MNTLFAYPIIIPSSSGGSGDIPPQIIWATLIVVNAVALIALIAAWLLNLYRNKGRERYKESLSSTIAEYSLTFLFFFGTAFIVDIIAVLVGLIYWVATLL